MSLFSTSDGEKIKVGNLDADVSDLFMVNISYATYTEYGYPPAPTNTIDSTAIVIDPETLALLPVSFGMLAAPESIGSVMVYVRFGGVVGQNIQADEVYFALPAHVHMP